MKVLLTGASGFVGSHVLDRLRAQGIATAVLLRPASNQRFINAHLPQLDVRNGSLSDPQSLGTALRDITHVIHCAGCVKALQVSEFYSQSNRHAECRRGGQSATRADSTARSHFQPGRWWTGGSWQARARRGPPAPRLRIRPEQTRRRTGSAELPVGTCDPAATRRLRTSRRRVPAVVQSRQSAHSAALRRWPVAVELRFCEGSG